MNEWMNRELISLYKLWCYNDRITKYGNNLKIRDYNIQLNNKLINLLMNKIS
jgi:hypothetical protein